MLNKVLQREFVIKNADDYLIKLGLIAYKNEERNHSLIRFFLFILGFIFLGKFWSSIGIWLLKCKDTNNCRQWNKYLGDLTLCSPKIRIHFNTVLSMFVCQSFITQITHNKMIYDGNFNDFKWMKLFHMLNGKIKPSQMGFTCSKDVIKFVNRFDILN